jgi:cytochrome P450
VSVSLSPQPSTNPLVRIVEDLRAERGAAEPLPPGPSSPSLARTHAFIRDPLPILLDAYERYGPVFTVRILHAPVVFMLGPEANHYMTVSHAGNFRWREGGMRDLIPLLGDGLLTIDGTAHRDARRVMLPAFHRERILAAGEAMLEETERAIGRLRDGDRVDVYDWSRRLALRIAMRALFGFDPDRADRAALAHEFEVGLGFYGRDYFFQVLRGPRTPWARMRLARRRIDEVIYAEIELRRAASRGGEDRTDLLGLLLSGRDEEGRGLSDEQVRDQVMTLLFAGHDTTTSTVTFLLYELARNPGELARVAGELDSVLGAAPATPAQLMAGLPQLDAALDETLRLYPAAWIGPRAAVESYEFAGCRVPAGSLVNYSSWASHRLPHVFPDPEAFVPDRFTPENRARLPKGAYVPFGGGSRMCIGMRFGQLEIKAIVSRLLQRFRFEQLPGRAMTVQTTPTLGPRGGLPMVVRERRGS